jgi:hypothetical protein
MPMILKILGVKVRRNEMNLNTKYLRSILNSREDSSELLKGWEKTDVITRITPGSDFLEIELMSPEEVEKIDLEKMGERDFDIESFRSKLEEELKETPCKAVEEIFENARKSAYDLYKRHSTLIPYILLLSEIFKSHFLNKEDEEGKIRQIVSLLQRMATMKLSEILKENERKYFEDNLRGLLFLLASNNYFDYAISIALKLSKPNEIKEALKCIGTIMKTAKVLEKEIVSVFEKAKKSTNSQEIADAIDDVIESLNKKL